MTLSKRCYANQLWTEIVGQSSSEKKFGNSQETNYYYGFY